VTSNIMDRNLLRQHIQKFVADAKRDPNKIGELMRYQKSACVSAT